MISYNDYIQNSEQRSWKSPAEMIGPLDEIKQEYVHCMPNLIQDNNINQELCYVSTCPQYTQEINQYIPDKPNGMYKKFTFGLYDQMYPNGYPEPQVMQPQQCYSNNINYYNPYQSQNYYTENNNYQASQRTCYKPKTLNNNATYQQPQSYSQGAINLANNVMNTPATGGDLFSKIATIQAINNTNNQYNYDPLNSSSVKAQFANEDASKYIRPAGSVWDEVTETWVDPVQKYGPGYIDEYNKTQKELYERQLKKNNIQNPNVSGPIQPGFKFLTTEPPAPPKPIYVPNYNITPQIAKKYNDNPLFGYLRLVADYIPENYNNKRKELIEKYNNTFNESNQYIAEGNRRYLLNLINQSTINPQVFGLQFESEKAYNYFDEFLDDQYKAMMVCMRSCYNFFRGEKVTDDDILDNVRKQMHPNANIKFDNLLDLPEYVPPKEHIEAENFHRFMDNLEAEKNLMKIREDWERQQFVSRFNQIYDDTKRRIPDTVGMMEFFNNGYGSNELYNIKVTQNKNKRLDHSSTFNSASLNMYIDQVTGSNIYWNYGFSKSTIKNPELYVEFLDNNGTILDKTSGRIHHVNPLNQNEIDDVIRKAQFSYSVMVPEAKGSI